jgi:hypothetical protein
MLTNGLAAFRGQGLGAPAISQSAVASAFGATALKLLDLLKGQCPSLSIRRSLFPTGEVAGQLDATRQCAEMWGRGGVLHSEDEFDGSAGRSAYGHYIAQAPTLSAE